VTHQGALRAPTEIEKALRAAAIFFEVCRRGAVSTKLLIWQEFKLSVFRRTYGGGVAPGLSPANRPKPEPRASSGLALQFHRDQLKGLIAQVLGQMYSRQKGDHLSSLAADLFRRSIRVRQAGVHIVKKDSHGCRVGRGAGRRTGSWPTVFFGVVDNPHLDWCLLRSHKRESKLLLDRGENRWRAVHRDTARAGFDRPGALGTPPTSDRRVEPLLLARQKPIHAAGQIVGPVFVRTGGNGLEDLD